MANVSYTSYTSYNVQNPKQFWLENATAQGPQPKGQQNEPVFATVTTPAPALPNGSSKEITMTGEAPAAAQEQNKALDDRNGLERFFGSDPTARLTNGSGVQYDDDKYSAKQGENGALEFFTKDGKTRLMTASVDKSGKTIYQGTEDAKRFDMSGFNLVGSGHATDAEISGLNGIKTNLGGHGSTVSIRNSSGDFKFEDGTTNLTVDNVNNSKVTFGNYGNNTLRGTASNTVFEDGDGNADFEVKGNNNTANGNVGQDRISFTGNKNTLNGGYNADLLDAHGDSNKLFGNFGDDILNADGKYNLADGGWGDNTINLWGTANTVQKDDKDDKVIVNGNIKGLVQPQAQQSQQYSPFGNYGNYGGFGMYGMYGMQGMPAMGSYDPWAEMRSTQNTMMGVSLLSSAMNFLPLFFI